MDYFTVFFCLFFILAITFAYGMRDLFPSRYKAFVNAQQREWIDMPIISYPLIQRALRVVQGIGWFNAVMLLIILCVSTLKHWPSGLILAQDVCSFGLGFILLALTVAKTFVFINGNAKSSSELDKSMNWAYLILYFISMNILINYWL